eukprot:1147524-Pelagomonas_calceolata.AAC.1
MTEKRKKIVILASRERPERKAQRSQVSRMVRRKLLPIRWVIRPEIHNQLTQVDRPFMADKRCEVQQEGFLALREISTWKTFGGDDSCNG